MIEPWLTKTVASLFNNSQIYLHKFTEAPNIPVKSFSQPYNSHSAIHVAMAVSEVQRIVTALFKLRNVLSKFSK